MSEKWIGNLELPFHNIREARARLGELERRRGKLQQMGQEMLQEFRERFPSAPAYPTRYSDRTLTGYRWRRAGHKAVSFDLTSETGRSLLDRLPTDVRKVWLAFERRRIHLNLALALTDYERIRLRDFLGRIDRLREAEV
ncbi:hypothetical protein TspCOW1_01190 [Thiohalobacter sp. COW1]|uniref:hypothetical protein n=1 Tax=Thiohalobacter sp. COW1 TaxID=2795687 RepID=UPI0019168134|nr:hypothetical protein [Thiohalobacter sp. COW1]BCO30016.1 hypothetical protein TspCOW1_01190 [Thiohalobacter sp. COW1]